MMMVPANEYWVWRFCRCHRTCQALRYRHGRQLAEEWSTVSRASQK